MKLVNLRNSNVYNMQPLRYIENPPLKRFANLQSCSESLNQDLNCTFRANLRISTGVDGSKVINSTYLFRDMQIMKSIVGYLRENGINSGNIVDFGCSDGSEIYTLAMLMDPDKKDFDFKFKGYDLSEEIIQDAKKGIFHIYNKKWNFKTLTEWDIDKKTDSFLLRSEDKLSDEQKMCKKLFHNYFYRTETPDNPDEFRDVIIFEMLKYGQKFSKYWDLQTYKVSDKLKQHCEFNVGNIKDLGNGKLNLSDGEKPKVIIFKNAWYHLTGNTKTLDPKDNWASSEELINLTKIVQGIFDSLDHKGILVVGNLFRDHIFIEQDIDKKNGISISSIYNRILKSTDLSQGKRVVEPNPFHEILKAVGFKPLQESILPTQYSIKHSNLPIIDVPTIWVKE